jgi:cytochrome c
MRILIVATALALLGTGPALAGDPANGGKVFKKCKACHQVEAVRKSPVGPNLHGVIGRTAGTTDFKRYSKQMQAAGEDGLVWTEETLAAYLEAPRKYLKGTRMAFPGLKKEADRADVIAYLKQQSGQ